MDRSFWKEPFESFELPSYKSHSVVKHEMLRFREHFKVGGQWVNVEFGFQCCVTFQFEESIFASDFTQGKLAVSLFPCFD